jgi:hypothetical protein
VIDGKLQYAWLQSVERKWGTSRYSGTICPNTKLSILGISF